MKDIYWAYIVLKILKLNERMVFPQSVVFETKSIYVSEESGESKFIFMKSSIFVQRSETNSFKTSYFKWVFFVLIHFWQRNKEYISEIRLSVRFLKRKEKNYHVGLFFKRRKNRSH